MTEGAEAAVGDVSDAEFLLKATSGAEALFFLIPPNLHLENFREYQTLITNNGVEAIKKNGIKHVVTVSSQGAHLKEGNGVVNGLTEMEDKFNQLDNVNVLHLRPTYFMENFFNNIELIKKQNINGNCIDSDLKFSMIATQDVAKVGAKILSELNFEGKEKLDLLGERDLSMKEATTIIGKAIEKPELPYIQLSGDDLVGAMVGMGLPKDSAGSIVELYDRINDGTIFNDADSRTLENTTETSMEEFASHFAEIYKQS